MNDENINKNNHPVRVLISPLDWGLGHATRCIPIINYLESEHIEVIVAGEGDILQILGKTQSKSVILPLKGYRVRYSRHRKLFLFTLLLQAPKIIAAIRNENKWLKKEVLTNNIDAVISDNRFGFHHPGVPSVFITHQLSIKTGRKWLDTIAQKINYYFINKFDECWVPDTAGTNNLAGDLSHPSRLPGIPVSYLGILSRFKNRHVDKTNQLLILLSGPEPQRTAFENILLPQLNDIKGDIILVRGLPGSPTELETINERLTIHNHLSAEMLNELILQSTNIVARCGYSTVMDLYTLRQNAILVPTPGQTEQEYLATYLLENNLFYTCSQENFSLAKALESGRKFNTAKIYNIPGLQKDVISKFIEKLKNRSGR